MDNIIKAFIFLFFWMYLAYPASASIEVTNPDFLLRVKGDGMKEVGILDGDLLAVHKTQIATNGQIVVARVEDEVTVKRFQRTRNKNQIFLYPENEDYNPIEVDLTTQSFSIEGLSVGVIRQRI